MEFDFHEFSLYNEVVMPQLNRLDEADKIYHILKSIAKNNQTTEMVENAIKVCSANSQKPILGVLSKRKLTKKLCQIAFQNDKRNFLLIPKNYIDSQMSKQAVGYNGSYLSYVPKQYITPELCAIAIADAGSNLEYVPEEFKTEELCIEALNNSNKDHYKYTINFIPIKIMRKIGREYAYRLAVEQNPASIQSVPSKYITEELAELAIVGRQKDVFGYAPIKYIPTRFLTESLVTKAVEFYPQSVRDIPEKYITVELCKKHPSCIEYLPLDYMSSNKRNLLCRELDLPKNTLASYSFLAPVNDKQETTNVVQINAIPSRRCVNENNKSLNYRTTQFNITNTIHATKKKKVNIYYITDLHLEYHIDLNGVTSNKAYELIDEFVKKMLVTADADGMILTGGDISSYTDINIMFYNSLRKNWKGQIFSVLGNHDLWNLDVNSHIGLKPENILKKLRSNTYGITFLENEIYIELSENVYGYNRKLVVTEKNILAVDKNELSEYCHKATTIILGGLAFSGCNNEFNEIYWGAVTREEDIENSKRFETIYNKLLYCANDVPVIVLTHTPMRDWSKQQYNSNWIYISGHTHKNMMAIKDNGAIILENNQFGYSGKFCCLKKFVLNYAIYNPLCDLDDGIHKISKLKYLDFMYTHKSPIQEMKQTGEVWVVKKVGYYLFFLKMKNKLYMLDGGKIRKTEKSLSYYYDNLDKYSHSIEQVFYSFYQYEKKISFFVKVIGGEGTIHGCIVDYDYYNHVYVNPFDTTLTPYYATSITNKWILKNFEALIDSGKVTQGLLFGETKITIDTNKNTLKHTLRLLNSKLTPTNSHNEVVTDISMYRISNIFRTLQYTIESHIIRKWNNDILNLPLNCNLSELSNYISDDSSQ